MIKFIHAADIHLDSCESRGLVEYDGAPIEGCRRATRRALENLVQLAINEQVHFVLIAGDIYDGDWKDARTGLFFISQLNRLRDAKINCYMIRGNHDAASEISRHLPLPVNRDETPMLLGHDRCETIILEDIGVAIHGRGFKTRAVTENLAATYAVRIPGMHNIGLLHTCMDGAEGHEPYSPCSRLELLAKEYEYWALGHIHLRSPPVVDDICPILFSGNLQGRHVRECGPKGAYLVEFSSGAPQITFHPLAVYRWEVCTLDITNLTTDDELWSAFSDAIGRLIQPHDLPVAARIEISGCTSLHQTLYDRLPTVIDQFKSLGISASNSRLWLEDVRLKTRPPSRLVEAWHDDGPLGELTRFMDQLQLNSQKFKELARPLIEMTRLLPPGIVGGGTLQPDDETWLSDVLEDVRPLLINRLSGSGEDR